MKRASVFLLTTILVACSSNPVPKQFLPPARMEKVVYDLIKADEYINSFPASDTTVDLKTRRIQLYEQVFAIHKTSREEFYKSYKYYEKHPNIHKVLFDSMQLQATRKKNATQQKLATNIQ